MRFYATLETPPDYRCKDCGAYGCKLWRETNCFAPSLFCVDCVNKKKGTHTEPDAGGRVPSEHGGQTDHFNGYVPAVPDEEGLGYWGFTSVPENGVNWWRALPLRVQR